MEMPDFLRAAQRLFRTLRAAAYPYVLVVGDLDANGSFSATDLVVDGQRTGWNPDIQTANITVEDSGGNTIAWAAWENGTISGEIDDAGILGALDWDWSWDDLDALVSSANYSPSGQRIDEGTQMPLPFPEGDIRDFPDDVADLFRVPSVSDTDFGHGLREWLQGMALKVGEIAKLDPDELLVKCHACETTMLTEDAHVADGEHYCDECVPEQCEGCGTWMDREESLYDEGSGASLCESCYSERQTGGVEEVWDEFNSAHPELEGVLDKADAEEEMDVETYITIFEDLSWSDAYGGKAWARIAETWRDMEELVSGLHDGGGENDNWVRLTATVDHAFDLVHNTGSLFTKAKSETQRWLFQALEDKYFLDPLQYRNKLSADGRKLLDAHIRQSGGVREWKKEIESKEQILERLEKALLRDYDFKMAIRVFRTYKLNARDFYGRDSFITVAFWQKADMSRIPGEVLPIREFLRQPSEDNAIKTMSAADSDAFKQGSNHPAAPVLRGQVLPKLLLYAKKSNKVREWLTGTKATAGLVAPRSRWRKLLQRERKDALEAKSVAAALGAAALMIRLALKQADFYDFYAMTVVEPDRLPEDLARYARGFKRVVTLQMAKDLLVILKKAVIREARHVSNGAAIQTGY